jgi:hypothetical protein
MSFSCCRATTSKSTWSYRECLISPGRFGKPSSISGALISSMSPFPRGGDSGDVGKKRFTRRAKAL